MMFISTALKNPSARLGRPLRVLLVEDQATNRMATQHLLRLLSHEAEAVANGREALETLSRREYDVVLMDLEMPEMGGLETTRRLRLLTVPGRQPRVIALTADDTPEDRASCLAAGMDDFLPKPLTRARLIEALGDLDEKRPLRAGRRASPTRQSWPMDDLESPIGRLHASPQDEEDSQ